VFSGKESSTPLFLSLLIPVYGEEKRRRGKRKKENARTSNRPGASNLSSYFQVIGEKKKEKGKEKVAGVFKEGGRWLIRFLFLKFIVCSGWRLEGQGGERGGGKKKGRGGKYEQERGWVCPVAVAETR